MGIAETAASGDRLATLQAVRDLVAAEIDSCDNAKDLAALVLRLTDVLCQIDAIPTTAQVSAADEIAERRAARRLAGAPGKARSASKRV